jgi:hypothetical protein
MNFFTPETLPAKGSLFFSCIATMAYFYPAKINLFDMDFMHIAGGKAIIVMFFA